jgi:hypothetical protein
MEKPHISPGGGTGQQGSKQGSFTWHNPFEENRQKSISRLGSFCSFARAGVLMRLSALGPGTTET